jgi:signal transduction histidine kinase
LGTLLYAVAMVLFTLGMIDYVGVAGPVARRLRLAVVVVGPVAALVILASGWPLAVAWMLYAIYLIGNALLAAWAMRREPQRGHGLVCIALSLMPGTMVASALGFIPPVLMRYIAIAPVSLAGATLLTIGLLRAHADAQAEVERRRAAEALLRALNDSLEHRVAQRTAELHDVVAGLESFNRNVSHDLRGPLGGMAALARLARDALAAHDLDKVNRMLELVATQADASAELVASLLALARVGEAELAPERVDLRALVDESIEQLRLSHAAPQQVVLEVQQLPPVQADPSLLRQVYVNLIGNAVKFSREAAVPHVEVGALRDDGGPVLFVRDNGVGFDPQCAATLFEPFQRLHGKRYEGSGVGLSIVKRIVERHGGRLWAESSPGRGATFYFTLRQRA